MGEGAPIPREELLKKDESLEEWLKTLAGKGVVEGSVVQYRDDEGSVKRAKVEHIDRNNGNVLLSYICENRENRWQSQDPKAEKLLNRQSIQELEKVKGYKEYEGARVRIVKKDGGSLVGTVEGVVQNPDGSGSVGMTFDSKIGGVPSGGRVLNEAIERVELLDK